MGAAFEVYNDRGYGLAEEIYQSAWRLNWACEESPFAPKPNCAVSTRAGS